MSGRGRRSAAAAGTRWGWHQLDPDWAARLVERAGVGRGDVVLDVGAGTGVLTASLVDVGARVIAIELHPARVEALRARFGNSVTVVRADATDLRLPRRPFRVVANPPFAATTALIKRLTHHGSRMMRADLVLDGRVARRWAEARGEFVGFLGPAVPRRAFQPAPPVDARVLTILPGRRARRVPGTTRART